MNSRVPREKETEELIRRFRARRARQRRLMWIATGVVVLIVAGIVVTAVAIAGGDGGSAIAAASTSSTTLTDFPPGNSMTTLPDLGSGTVIADIDMPSSTTAVTTRTTTTPRVTTTTRRATTTTARASTTTARTAATTTNKTQVSQAAASDLVVVIDPGHQAHGDSSLEPMGPGSSEKKAKVSSGTSGTATGIPESKLVLTVGLKLRDMLQAQGINVVMTRTSENVNLSNIARAKIANDAKADLFIRIHADGSESSSTSGIHVLYPGSIKGWTDDIAGTSKKAATITQRNLIGATGAKDRGIDARSDMTGFNWSDVPVILPEIGFMTNSAEDRALATSAYQDKVARGLAQAVLEFLGVK